MRVIVVSTVHRETGAATASALQAILERIRPEVVFLEFPSDGFDSYLDGTLRTPETMAANGYRVLHQTTLVPVDQPIPQIAFKHSIDLMFERIEETSPEYNMLRHVNDQYVYAYGFVYLNSEHNRAICVAIQQAMRAAIDVLGDPRLEECYASWVTLNENRETAMMECIEEYSRKHPFTTGVFLVGSAHSQSIFDKSRIRPERDGPKVHWAFEETRDFETS